MKRHARTPHECGPRSLVATWKIIKENYFRRHAASRRNVSAVARTVRDTRFGEAERAQAAGVAVTAGTAVVVCLVTRYSGGEIDAEFVAAAHDVGLGEADQRRMHAELCALDAGLGGKVGETLERLDELGPAVGITRVIDRVDTAEDVLRAEHLGPAERERKHDRIARRHVSYRDAPAAPALIGILWHGDVIGQRGAADAAQVDAHGLVRDRVACGDALRGGQFRSMALAVLDAERVASKALRTRDRECNGGIHAAREEDDCAFAGAGHVSVRHCGIRAVWAPAFPAGATVIIQGASKNPSERRADSR